DEAQAARGDGGGGQRPGSGTAGTAGETGGEGEATKAGAEREAPRAGKGAAGNSERDGTPQGVKADPDGAGRQRV
ncbi:glycine cleavage system protein H, partial [Mycobacterium tuberculosis]